MRAATRCASFTSPRDDDRPRAVRAGETCPIPGVQILPRLTRSGVEHDAHPHAGVTMAAPLSSKPYYLINCAAFGEVEIRLSANGKKKPARFSILGMSSRETVG